MAETILDATRGRFERFKLISWWDQSRLSQARAVVIGAGALGNEIVKNLALLGIGRVFVADMDRVEESNLSRSVLFRDETRGRFKAEAAVEAAKQIYPGLRAQAFVGNVVHDLGLGIFRWADAILGGLDNREARVWINRGAARAGRPWIDGAIERLEGVARVFDAAAGPCYECTMSEVDWKLLEARRSCALLSRSDLLEGKVPTTPTTASIIAGIQCQEAVKLLHGMETMAGGGFVFNGLTHDSYTVRYRRAEDCPSHEADAPVELLPQRSDETSVGSLLERVRSDLGADALLEFNQDLLADLACPRCGSVEPMHTNLGRVGEERGRCGQCGEHRTPRLFHTIDGSEDFLDRSVREIGVPSWDVLCGRSGFERRYYEFREDAAELLGELADSAAREACAT